MILNDFLELVSDTEPPPQFYRWSFLTCISAKLGRRVYFPFMHGKIHPNMYVILTGLSSSRKSVAMDLARKILAASGYRTFAYSKSSKQKFLIDMSEGFELQREDGKFDLDAALDAPMPGAGVILPELCREVFICHDELINFFGKGNLEFVSLISELWDYNKPTYDERFKNSDSVSIPNPTVTLLGGIQPSLLPVVLPEEVMGQGFFARTIFVHSSPTNKKITFPEIIGEDKTQRFVDFFSSLEHLRGEAIFTAEARKICDEIYTSWENTLDVKLDQYAGRRLIHLFKLCMICAAMDLSLTVTGEHVICANTILTYTESGMPAALSEFGKNKNIGSTGKVLQCLESQKDPMDVNTLWEKVCDYFNSMHELSECLRNLSYAKKIVVDRDTHLIALACRRLGGSNQYVDFERYIKEYEPDDRLDIL